MTIIGNEEYILLRHNIAVTPIMEMNFTFRHLHLQICCEPLNSGQRAVNYVVPTSAQFTSHTKKRGQKQTSSTHLCNFHALYIHLLYLQAYWKLLIILMMLETYAVWRRDCLFSLVVNMLCNNESNYTIDATSM